MYNNAFPSNLHRNALNFDGRGVVGSGGGGIELALLLHRPRTHHVQISTEELPG